ncbi:hypothetical protein BN979_00002 [Mycolicibacterium vulneris]|nr:hypothetical protein BN979_00002 [Mycolicibacterium vulneris]
MRTQQPGHVLDRQHMRTGVDDLLGQLEVVIQRVQILAGVGQVSGVGHRHFGDRGAGLADRVDRRTHRLHIVECVEDPEDIDARGGGFLDERLSHQFRVRGVSHGVAAPQQHLQTDVGHRLAQRGQPLPRIFLQKAKRHIVGRATPTLDGQQLRHHPRHIRRHLEQPRGPQPGGEQRLMGVAERRIGDPQRRAVTHPRREPLGPQLDQTLLGTRRRHRRQIQRRQFVLRIHPRRAFAVGLVHRDISQVIQDLGTAIGRGVRGQQLRTIIDERRGDPSGPEIGILDHRLQKRDVRRHPTNPELGQRSAGPGHRRGEVTPATGQLDQHRVEMRQHLGADIGAAVQAHPRTPRRPVGGDPAGVRTKAIGRILGGDPALHRCPTNHQRILTQPQIGQALPRRDPQLRTHQVHVGDLLSHRVLHLNPRIALDEHMMTTLIQQKLDGPRTGVPDLARQGHRIRADPLAQPGIQIRRRRQLDHLLMPPLHTAIPLEQVHHIALGIGQDLHLDVPRVDDGLLQIHLRVAERRLRFPRRRLHRLGQRLRVAHPPHAAPTTTGHRLDEQRERHIGCRSNQLVHRRRRRRRRQHRQSRRLGRRDRPRLVPRQFQNLRRRPHKRDARLRTRRRQLRVLRQEPVTRIHRIRTRMLGHPDDLVHRQIRPNRMADLTDLIRLVGLQPVQRVAVLVRIHRHRRDTHLISSTKRTDSDLATVGD